MADGNGGKIESITPRASRQAIDGTIKFLRERTGLVKLAQQAEKELEEALDGEDD